MLVHFRKEMSAYHAKVTKICISDKGWERGSPTAAVGVLGLEGRALFFSLPFTVVMPTQERVKIL